MCSNYYTESKYLAMRTINQEAEKKFQNYDFYANINWPKLYILYFLHNRLKKTHQNLQNI